jgi:hypothetical protein
MTRVDKGRRRPLGRHVAEERRLDDGAVENDRVDKDRSRRRCQRRSRKHMAEEARGQMSRRRRRHNMLHVDNGGIYDGGGLDED